MPMRNIKLGSLFDGIGVFPLVLPVKISRLQAVVRAYREVSPLCFLKRSES